MAQCVFETFGPPIFIFYWPDGPLFIPYTAIKQKSKIGAKLRVAKAILGSLLVYLNNGPHFSVHVIKE